MTDEQQLTAAGNEISASFLAAKKRSDETLAKLEAKPSSFTMLTGDRPTGRLHLGHYFGSIRERVAMQERGVNTNIIIADYQVITDRDTTEHIQDNVLNLVLDYMAAGIDPNKTMMFTHSAAQEDDLDEYAKWAAEAAAKATSGEFPASAPAAPKPKPAPRKPIPMPMPSALKPKKS